MRVSVTPALCFLVCVANPIAAQGPAIDHRAVGCVVAERYPVIDASLDPADSVSRARVYFRSSGTTDWYFVEMRREGPVFQAVLPKPLKTTRSIDYYVQALDTAFAEGRTPEYQPAVVANAKGCSNDLKLAVALTSTKVTLGAVAGAPVLPVGFSNAGVATLAGTSAGTGAAAGAAGGGLSTGLVVGVLGAGAAAAGVAAAAGGGGSDEPTDSGSGPPPSIRLSITITSPGSPPRIDVSTCAGSNVTFGGGTVTLASDGSFNETWSPTTPNTLRLQGRADASSFQAALSCAATSGPTGSMTANGSNYNLSGSFSFGNQQGSITVARQQ